MIVGRSARIVQAQSHSHVAIRGAGDNRRGEIRHRRRPDAEEPPRTEGGGITPAVRSGERQGRAGRLRLKAAVGFKLRCARVTDEERPCEERRVPGSNIIGPPRRESCAVGEVAAARRGSESAVDPVTPGRHLHHTASRPPRLVEQALKNLRAVSKPIRNGPGFNNRSSAKRLSARQHKRGTGRTAKGIHTNGNSTRLVARGAHVLEKPFAPPLKKLKPFPALPNLCGMCAAAACSPLRSS